MVFPLIRLVSLLNERVHTRCTGSIPIRRPTWNIALNYGSRLHCIRYGFIGKSYMQVLRLRAPRWHVVCILPDSLCNPESGFILPRGIFGHCYLFQVNFWKEPSRVRAPVDVMVPSQRQSLFEALLAERDLGYIVTIRDVQK